MTHSSSSMLNSRWDATLSGDFVSAPQPTAPEFNPIGIGHLVVDSLRVLGAFVSLRRTGSLNEEQSRRLCELMDGPTV